MSEIIVKIEIVEEPVNIAIAATEVGGGASTPSAHKASHATGGADALTPADIGAQPAGSYAPATGISPSAISGTAVITTDFRLSNARPPTAHTHPVAQITGLGALATLSSVSLTSQVTDTLPVEFGGTGATTVDGARAALGIPEFSEEPTISTAAKRTADGALHATYFWAAGYPSSFGGFSTNGQVEFNGEDAGDSITFRMVNYFYEPAAALAHRTALGSGATGDPLFTADTPAAARETLQINRTRVTQAADLASATTAFANTDLVLTLEGGVDYLIRGMFEMVSAANGTGFKLQLSTSQNMNLLSANGGTVGWVASSAGMQGVSLLTLSRSDFFGITALTTRRVQVEFRLNLVATGTVRINFAQNALGAAPDSLFKAGSWLASERL